MSSNAASAPALFSTPPVPSSSLRTVAGGGWRSLATHSPSTCLPDCPNSMCSVWGVFSRQLVFETPHSLREYLGKQYRLDLCMVTNVNISCTPVTLFCHLPVRERDQSADAFMRRSRRLRIPVLVYTVRFGTLDAFLAAPVHADLVHRGTGAQANAAQSTGCNRQAAAGTTARYWPSGSIHNIMPVIARYVYFQSRRTDPGSRRARTLERDTEQASDQTLHTNLSRSGTCLEQPRCCQSIGGTNLHAMWTLPHLAESLCVFLLDPWPRAWSNNIKASDSFVALQHVLCFTISCLTSCSKPMRLVRVRSLRWTDIFSAFRSQIRCKDARYASLSP